MIGVWWAVLGAVAPFAGIVLDALVHPERPAAGRPLEPPDRRRRRRSRFGLAA